MRAFAVIVVSLVAGCAPYTYDTNGNAVPFRGSAAYYGTLTTSDSCGGPDHPKACPAKRQAASSARRSSPPQSAVAAGGAEGAGALGAGGGAGCSDGVPATCAGGADGVAVVKDGALGSAGTLVPGGTDGA
jgi:hypothetical protein